MSLTKKVTAFLESPNALIQIYDRPYISCQEISLTKGADLYFTGILIPETALRQGILPSPYEQLFEVSTGTQDFICTFKGAQRQFGWLEILYDGYKH